MVSGIAKYVRFVVNGPKTCKTADYPLCNSGIFFFSSSVTLAYIRSAHYFLATAPMSGVLFALQLTEAQIDQAWVWVYRRQGHRGWTPWSYLHTGGSACSYGISGTGAFCLRHRPTTPDRACNQGPHMRCVLRRAARQSRPPASLRLKRNQPDFRVAQTYAHTRSSLAVTAD